MLEDRIDEWSRRGSGDCIFPAEAAGGRAAVEVVGYWKRTAMKDRIEVEVQRRR
jgi:hypothetical protein